MVVQDLKKMNEAPTEGILLAYLREKIIFERYKSLDEVMKKLCEKNLLEIHMFDQDKEYRAISSTSKRFPTGAIEEVVDFSYIEGALDCSVTEGLTDSNFNAEIGKIKVINHLFYDDNGTVTVDNYRLAEEV